MRFLHLSDLHIGKRYNEYSMLEDQRYIFKQILEIIEENRVEAVLIAGDVYDKSSPSADAVAVLDELLTSLYKKCKNIFLISGNHDSPERIGFGSRLLSSSGVHLSPVYKGEVTSVRLSDEYGEIEVFMLPFIKPCNVRQYYTAVEINSYTDAVKAALSDIKLNPENRNILITHQFVTGASRCESEEISVGGTDNCAADAFDGFDYVALGHLHNPQSVSRETVRYCGTPLKYSVSEAKVEKSVTIVDLFEKDNIKIQTVRLNPMRDVREVKGSFEEVSVMEKSNDYVKIILTDEQEITDCAAKLRAEFPNMLYLEYDNSRTRNRKQLSKLSLESFMTPQQLFGELFKQQYGREMSERQFEILNGFINGNDEEEVAYED